MILQTSSVSLAMVPCLNWNAMHLDSSLPWRQLLWFPSHGSLVVSGSSPLSGKDLWLDAHQNLIDIHAHICSLSSVAALHWICILDYNNLS